MFDSTKKLRKKMGKGSLIHILHSPPTFFPSQHNVAEPVAQLVEHLIGDRRVAGKSCTAP